MARSRRKYPICGITTADSEKQDKRRANRRIRRAVAQRLTADPEAELLPHRRALSNPWTMEKDGKAWFDAVAHPELMRK